MKFTGVMYDRLKFIAQIALPGLGTLYFTLAAAWDLPSAEAVVSTIVAVDTFLGVLLGISSSQYNNSPEKFDGTLSFEDHEEGTALRLSSVDLTALDNKDEMTFKVVRPVPTE